MRRALVTGGAAGIGEATVRRLVADGNKVTFCDRDTVAGARLAREEGAEFIALDAADPLAVGGFLANQQPYEILVNNVVKIVFCISVFLR